MYAPHGVQFKCSEGISKVDVLYLSGEKPVVGTFDLVQSDWDLSEIRLILKNLEDITDEDAICISKLLGDIHNDGMDEKFKIKTSGRMLVHTPWGHRIEMFYGKKLNKIDFAVYDTYNYCEKRVRNVVKVIQYLASKHYDIFNLIERGDAIDMNSVT